MSKGQNPLGGFIRDLGLLDALPQHIAIIDDRGVIQYVNRAWKSFAAANGYTGPGFVGQNYFDICKTADGAERAAANYVLEGLYSVVHQGAKSFHHIYPCHSKKASRCFAVSFTRLETGTIIQHHEVDIETLRSADVEARMAHDLKSSINGMLMTIENIGETLRESADVGAALSKLDNIDLLGRQVVERLDAAIGKTPQHPHLGGDEEGAVVVEKVLQRCVDLVRPSAGGKRITIAKSDADEAHLVADEFSLERLFLNLIDNAVKFTGDPGCVCISVSITPSKAIEVTVADDGCGIEAESLAHIFESRWRELDHPNEPDGAGLGLATVRHIADELGAVIDVDSAEGRGSQFRVTFPAWRTA